MDEKIISALLDGIKRTDTINKRLVVCIITLAIVFGACIAACNIASYERDCRISHDYFTQDYNYATVNQTVTGDNNQSQTNGDDINGETSEAEQTK